MFQIPRKHHLTSNDIKALEAFSKLCRQDIIKMVSQAKSGHPGGSCSIIDILATLYASMTHFPSAPDYDKRDRVVFSAGHLSPAAYSILGELGYFLIDDAIPKFRKHNSPFEGHVFHGVPGIEFTNGSLGKGLSQAAGIAHAAKLHRQDFHVFAIMGDGEQEEGQVAEARRSITKFGLNNLTIVIDHNGQQLDNPVSITASTLDIKKEYLAAGFAVYEINGHDYQAINHALFTCRNAKHPTVIIANTLMGKGISFMEKAARQHSSEWHGKAPSPEQAEKALSELTLSDEQIHILKEYGYSRNQAPMLSVEASTLRAKRDNIPAVMLSTGTPRTYTKEEKIDNRSAFGNALLDIARLNPGKIIGMTCDIGSSVRMGAFGKEYPHFFVDEGISEQHMLSKAGALSLNGFCVFASTFGVFLSALAADQARINDINHARVKMIATHCGLDVGEDGMTHQCITDLGFMRGLFNTIVLEPADPNQADHMIRAIANIHTNCYVRMGRTNAPIITRLDGSAFFDAGYVFRIGSFDTLREGNKLAVIATGATIAAVLDAVYIFNKRYYKGKQAIRVLIPTSLHPLDESMVIEAAKGMGCIITLEDHNPSTGLGSAVAGVIARRGIKTRLTTLGPGSYSSSGKAAELYADVGISSEKIVEKFRLLLNK